MANSVCTGAATSHRTKLIMHAYEAYLKKGWRVVPFRRDSDGNPKPSIKYREAQDNPQKACAIIAGRCDGLLLDVASLGNGLVIDFDDVATYNQWSKSHPELASDCPTVKTQRGYHVYAILAAIDKPRKYKVYDQPIDVFEGIGQIVLPPSLGKDGTTEYTWTEIGRTIPTISDIGEILPSQSTADTPGGVKYLERLSYLSSGIVVDTPLNHWKSARFNVPSRLLDAATLWYQSHAPLVSVSTLDPPGEIAAYLWRTMPKRKSTRNRKLLELVRLLRRVTPTANANDLIDLVAAWIMEAIERQTTTAYEPDPTIREFEYCWNKYDRAKESLINQAIAYINSSEPVAYDPTKLKGVLNHFPYRRLCSYCTAASVLGSPFQMSVSVVQDICFQSESKSAWQYIEKLSASGIIEQAQAGVRWTNGQKSGGKAACYRYLGL